MEFKEIINKLSHDGGLFRMQGLLACIRAGAVPPEVIPHIKALKTDQTLILGYRVSALAIAALDRLGIEKYDGKDEMILGFINNL